MRRTVKAFGQLTWGKAFALALCAMTMALPAQTFTTLHSFSGTEGAGPGALVQGTDGDLYGIASAGGANGGGTVFKITPSGTLTTLYNFCAQAGCTDGEYPIALVQATNGDFYGTASGGGSYGSYGTVFKMTPAGRLKTLYSFCAQAGCADGAYPEAGLVQATNGDLYGTTEFGGANVNCSGFGFPPPPPEGCGTLFKITPGGTLTTLYNFCSESGCTDGELPFGALVEATNGDLYGTTSGLGIDFNGTTNGTVFKTNPNGTLTTLHNFCTQSTCLDGESPLAGLVQAANGYLYGITTGLGCCMQPNYGTFFKMSPSGTLTTLYDFCNQSECADGNQPRAALVQAANGDFYGTTYDGGLPSCYYGCGTAFKVTPSGTLTTLYSFCSQSGCADGFYPLGGLFQATNGNFYGTTSGGGASGNNGTVFSLSVGLGPFVETLPTSGKVGAEVKILGTSLKGATSVTFNGTTAEFTVVSASEITANVPADATTGTVEVVTPSGTLSSTVAFRVTP